MELPLEKLVIKMWDTLLDKGIGTLLTPWNIRREGLARIDVRQRELLLLAQTEMDIADIRAGRKQMQNDGTLLLTSNINKTLIVNKGQVDLQIEQTVELLDVTRKSDTAAMAENARREINSSKAILYAEEQLAGDSQEPPSREVEDDWLFTWREYSGRIAAEDLQRLWGSVLAGEVKSPGKYSMRTLELLKTLSKAEAEEISRLARYSIDGRIARSQKGYLETMGIKFGLLLRMQQMGIVSGVEAIGLNVTYKTSIEGKFIKPLLSNGKVLIVENDDAAKTLTLDVYMLTEVGKQILGLGTFEPDLEYLKLVGKQIITQGFKVKLCDWRQTSEDEGEYFNPVNIDA